MERAELAATVRQPGPAYRIARQALEDGAPYSIDDVSVDVGWVLTLYRRRAKNDQGRRIVGLDQAVTDLTAAEPKRKLRLASISVADPPRQVQLFLAEDTGEPLACLAVERR